jgi:hypothetical protein
MEYFHIDLGGYRNGSDLLAGEALAALPRVLVQPPPEAHADALGQARRTS